MSATLAIKELHTSYRDKKAGQTLCSPASVAKAFSWLSDEPSEHFLVVHVNTKNRVVSYETVAIGGLSVAIVEPRSVFRSAILANAASIILVHNHPSGEPEPSREDVALTRRLQEGAKLLAIELIDHVIIGDGRHLSLREASLLVVS